MKDLKLQPISLLDIEWLDKTEYKNLSFENRKRLVEDSERGVFKGEFFRFYLIKDKDQTVGVINMCGHGDGEVSVAPEIFIDYRNKGYATESLKEAYSIAKTLGFNKAIAGIRKENLASQRLHEKLGFSSTGESLSKNGNVLINYEKRL